MDRLRTMEMFLSISRAGSFTETARLFGGTSISRMITEFRREHPDIHFELVLAEVKADLRRQLVSPLAGSHVRAVEVMQVASSCRALLLLVRSFIVWLIFQRLTYLLR